MPNPNKDSVAVKYLKAISMFDPEKDFAGKDAESKKDHLAMAFRELIMMDDPMAKEFFKRFKSSVDKIIKDMKVVSKTASDTAGSEEEVDMTPTPPEGEAEAPMAPEAGGGEEETPEGGNMEAGQAFLNAGYNPLIDRANSFLYM
jgi:hypothetical protein